MRKKKPHVAVMDEVRIVRRGQYAEIEYCDPTVAGASLKVGPEVQNMTDQEIVNRLNDVIRAQQKMAAQHEYVAVENTARTSTNKVFRRMRLMGSSWWCAQM